MFGLFESERDRFAKALMKQFTARSWPYRLSYDPKSFTIATDSEVGTIHLANFFADWKNYPAIERDAALDKIVSINMDYREEPLTWEASQTNVLPALRSINGLVELNISQGKSARMLAGDVAQLLVVDGASTMAMVTDELLESWGLGFDEVWPIALDNLRLLSEPSFERDEAGFFIARYGDYHDASRILLPDHLESLKLNGDPVAVILSRQDLIVAGSDDLEALDAVGQAVTRVWGEITRPVSFIPYVYREGAWSPFEGGDQAGALDQVVLAGRELLRKD